MEQESSELERTLSKKISEIFKKPYFIRIEIKEDLKHKSYVAQLENELKRLKSKNGIKEISENELREISEYCKLLRKELYNPNYQYIPLNLD